MSNASLVVLKLKELPCLLYITLGINSNTFSLILLTLVLGILINASKILCPLNTTSSFGIKTENSPYISSGKCHLYCDFADKSSKKTGMQPARRLSKVDLRVGVSPGGCKQKLACNIGFMYLIGSCSHAPLEQSTTSHSFTYPPRDWVTLLDSFSHSFLMLRRMLGVAETPPPPAKSIKVDLLDRLTRRIHDSKKERVGG